MPLDRRTLLALGLAGGLCGCGVPLTPPAGGSSTAPGGPASTVTPRRPTSSGSPNGSAASTGPSGTPGVAGTPIGDGSQAPSPDPQPFQRPITKLKRGERPPQFVVFSWDGASGNENHILEYVDTARAVDGTQTMFLSALYFLPKSKRTEYHPPKHSAGAADIPFMSDKTVRRTIKDTSIAWRNGNEIGTHFCGHFDAGRWTSADWEQEVSQVYKLVTTWRTITGWTDIAPLPFDYTKELVGGRTPLLEGRTALLPVARKRGWRYDSSGVRDRQAWPRKDAHGLYDMSMFLVRFRGRPIIPMDYNFLVAQAGGRENAGSAADRAAWAAEHLRTLRAGLQRCLRGNRAPYIMGNHLSPWLGGLYQRNLLKLMTEFGRTPGVQLVSFRWLCDWMDAQDPHVLADLQGR